MKRNFLTLLLAGALVFSSSTVSMAADLTDTEQVPTAAEELTAEQENSDQEVIEAEIVEETNHEAVEAESSVNAVSEIPYQFISGNDAIAAIGADDVLLLDVRSAGRYAAGHLKGSLSLPVFDENNNLPEELSTQFTAYVNSNPAEFQKKIYILCNSGKRGAQRATELLINCGYDNSSIYTIEGGAAGEDIKEHLYRYVTGEEALNVGSDTIILDVRAYDKYSAGHLANAVWCPIFPLDDATLETQMTVFAKFNLIPSQKQIYLLCNSGSRGAEKATKVLKAAGVDPSKIATIEGGAAGDVIKAQFTAEVSYQFVTAEEAVNAVGNANILLLDVRSAEKYAAGHLKGSVSVPVFDKDNNLPETLQAQFTAYVNSHRADFLKPVYILCNSGKRGAQTATKLLNELGISSVYTIQGGAANEVIQKNFVTADTEVKPETKPEVKPEPKPETKPEVKPETKPSTPNKTTSPKTGDTATAVPYIALLGAAVVAIIGKNKFIK